MDGVSGAASGMAVVSLALQLGGSIKQLYDFWESVNEAPDEIREITTDLSLLASVLTEIASEEQHSGPDHTLKKVLETCCNRVNKLTRITSDMEPGFASRSLRARKWTAFKAALKGEKIRKFQTILEGLKSTLMLAQQSHHSRLNRIRYEAQQRNLVTITNHVSGLNLEQFSATITTVAHSLSAVAAVDGQTNGLRAEASRTCRNIQDPVRRVGSEVGPDIAVQGPAGNLSDDQSTASWPVASPVADRSALLHRDKITRRSKQQTMTKSTLRTGYLVTTTLFGTITTSAKTRFLTSKFSNDDASGNEEYQYENESCFRILPAQWLLKLGFNYAYNFSTHDSSTQGWQWCIKPINLVPDDAPIFEFCYEGNFEEVRNLISRNLASVRDVDSYGSTALHFAVSNHNPGLCRFLIEAGADKNAQTFDYRSYSPLEEIMFGSFAEDGLVKAIDTCRLFEDSFDFWDETGDGWSILEYMLLHICSQPTIREAEQLLALFSWITQSFIADIKANYSTRKVQRMAYFSEDRVADTVESLLRLSPPEVLNEPKMINFEHAPLVHRHIISQNWKLVNLFLAYGADPHRVSSNSCKSGNAETPLSLAMYSSWAFWTFRNILHERSFDLEEFARQELQEGHPLFDAGWQMETLTALLELDFEPEIEPCKEFGETYYCDNCGESVFSHHIQVQPYWRGVLESIRDDTYPQQICADREDEQPTTSQSHFTISNKDSLLNTTNGSESSLDPALPKDEAAQSDEEPPNSGSDTQSTVFDRKEFWCIWCWRHFKETGQRRTPASPKTQSLDEDDSSDDDFSPYLFNT